MWVGLPTGVMIRTSIPSVKYSFHPHYSFLLDLGTLGYFLSMVKLKLATAIEMMTIIFPEYFLAMGSAANSIKVLPHDSKQCMS